MADIYFSMIVYVDDDETLERALKSITGISTQLRDQVRLIIADAVCSERSIDLCDAYEKKLRDECFCYIKTYGLGIGEAYNAAIPQIQGRYVNFSLASTWFTAGCLDAVWAAAEEAGRPKLVSLAPWTVNEKHEVVQYKMSPVDKGDCFSREIHLNQEPNQLQLMFHAYFIRCYLIKSKERHMWFRPELQDDTCMEMLLNLLAEIRGYLYLPSFRMNYTHQLEDNMSAYTCQQQVWWYMDSLDDWIIPLAKKWNEFNFPLRKFIRIALYYLVFVRFNCNYNNRNKNVLSQDQAMTFCKLAGQVFQYIDSTLIYKKDTIPNFTIPRGLRILFLKLKADSSNKICESVLYGDRLFAWTHTNNNENNIPNILGERNISKDIDNILNKKIDYTKGIFTVSQEDENQIPEIKWAYEDDTLIPLCEIEKEHVILKAINYERGNLVIDGLLSLGDFLPKDQIKLFIIYDGKKQAINFSDIYGLNKVFGITFEHKYMFQTSVFLLKKEETIQFAIELNEMTYFLDIRTQSVYSRVYAGIKQQYWFFSGELYLQLVGKKKMVISRANPQKRVSLENAFQKELQNLGSQGDMEALHALKLRKSYFKKREHKRIWVTFDKLYKAGDNGEYIYKYISDQNKDIEIYYIINEDSRDYKRLVSSGERILKWGDDEALLTVLRAEAILDTHADAYSFTGFNSKIMPYIGDLFNAKIICIQHGLTVQNIANFQNRLVDNINLYLCASEKEIENLSRSIYGYRHETLKLTGLARFDGLKNNDKRQILITPTWRRGLAVSSKMGSRRDHSDAFKNSEYFRIYNSVINDSKLIQMAKKTGYKIVYLLHPVLTSQLEDFSCPVGVEILTTVEDMSYEQILTESSLMVTDYSGIQFDFAYMKKPILYYHPKALPPHFDESKAYRYERDAFGPIIDNHEELVESLCEYMKNQCRMKAEYQERVDRFFAYHDFNNCKRIYEAIMEYMEEEQTNLVLWGGIENIEIGWDINEMEDEEEEIKI